MEKTIGGDCQEEHWEFGFGNIHFVPPIKNPSGDVKLGVGYMRLEIGE